MIRTEQAFADGRQGADVADDRVGIGERADDPLAMYLSDAFTIPADLAGIPAISIPCGLDGAGLPVGFQRWGVVGRGDDLAPPTPWKVRWRSPPARLASSVAMYWASSKMRLILNIAVCAGRSRGLTEHPPATLLQAARGGFLPADGVRSPARRQGTPSSRSLHIARSRSIFPPTTFAPASTPATSEPR